MNQLFQPRIHFFTFLTRFVFMMLIFTLSLSTFVSTIVFDKTPRICFDIHPICIYLPSSNYQICVAFICTARENGKKYQDPRFYNSYSFGSSVREILLMPPAKMLYKCDHECSLTPQLGLNQLELENPLNFKKENCIVSYCGLLGALYLTPRCDPVQSTYSTTV